MNNKTFFGLLLAAAVILTSWFVFGGSGGMKKPVGNTPVSVQSPTPVNSKSGGFSYSVNPSGPESTTEKGGGNERTVVTYTDTGFAPSPVTIKQGSTVTFVNESSRGMWVASGVHPTHQLLPGFDQLSSVGKTGVYEYTFMKTGTWSYHNHLRPEDGASVIVTQ